MYSNIEVTFSRNFKNTRIISRTFKGTFKNNIFKFEDIPEHSGIRMNPVKDRDDADLGGEYKCNNNNSTFYSA